MAKLYYDLIKGGYRTIEDVPERWREATQKLLDEEQKESDI